MPVLLFALFVVAAALAQGHAINEFTLPDDYQTHLTNNLIGKSLKIPKSFLDLLTYCHVIFPNGAIYEVYPINRLPADSKVIFLETAQPFTTCRIGFLGADDSMSGTYELMSTVYHTFEGKRSLTRQKFHLTLIPIDPRSFAAALH